MLLKWERMPSTFSKEQVAAALAAAKLRSTRASSMVPSKEPEKGPLSRKGATGCVAKSTSMDVGRCDWFSSCAFATKDWGACEDALIL